jgi:phosphoglycerate dehydrogenase-like enzyme
VLSPHCAGTNATSEAAVAHRCIDSILALARGEGPEAEYLLNPEVLPAGCRAVSRGQG